MEKNISLTQDEFFKLCNLNNNEAIKEIMSYVRCKSCRIFLEEPLYCIKCDLITCKNCHKKNCGNIPQKSRHIETIIENVNFKCLYYSKGCDKEKNYFELLKHINKCNKKPEENFIKSQQDPKKEINYMSKNYEENFDIKDNLFFSNLKNSIKISKIKLEKGDEKLTCNICEIIQFNSIEEFIMHKKTNCKENILKEKKNDNSNNINMEIDTDIDKAEAEAEKLSKSYLDAKNNYLSYINSTFENNFSIFSNFFNKYNQEFYKKKEKIEDLIKQEKESKKYYVEIKDNDYIENLLKNDAEFENLLQVEKTLLKKKDNLQEKLNGKLFEIQKFKNDTKNEFEGKYKILDMKFDDLLKLEMNLNNFVNGKQLNTIMKNNSICGSCNNNNPEVNKIFCGECKTFFCENCISYCKSESCKDKKTVICKQHTKKCGICDRLDFCDSCIKECYHTKCENKFCPNCFRRNKHQIRNPELNCKFFTCEKCNFIDCIMCSLFCQKCELRLCKGCFKKDAEHFSFLVNPTYN